MIALFGSKWTSQFGEQVDPSGQWAKTLEGVTRAQIAGGLESVRMSGRVWPPTAPEFRAMCAHGDTQQLKSVDQAVSEFHRYLQGNRRDRSILSPEVYHTLVHNCSEYTLSQMSYEKCDYAFRSAYRATVEDYRQGYALAEPPKPETLIERQPEPELSPEERAERERKGRETIETLMTMFGNDESE